MEWEVDRVRYAGQYYAATSGARPRPKTRVCKDCIISVCKRSLQICFSPSVTSANDCKVDAAALVKKIVELVRVERIVLI